MPSKRPKDGSNQNSQSLAGPDAAHHELKPLEKDCVDDQYSSRRIIETTTDGVWIVDHKGIICEVNDAACKMSGYRRDELLEMAVKDIEVVDSTDEINARIDELRRNGFGRFETRHRRKDGTIIDVEISASIFNRAKTKGIVFIRDITGRKRAENALRKSETRYKDIFNNILDIYVETDLDGKVVEVSPSFETYVGYKREEVIGKPVRIFYADPEKREEMIKAVISKGILYDFEVDAIHKDGHRVPFSMTSTLLKDAQGNPRKLIGMVRYIGERKRAENELKKQKKLFETMFDTIPDAVVLTNTHGEIQLVNKSVESIFGYRSEEVLGKSGKIFYADPREYDQASGAEPDRKNALPQNSYVSRYRHKDGREFSGETIDARLLDEKNGWIGNLRITRDITDREQAELRLRQAQKMESIGSLAGGIAHDFNNILSSIIGFTELAIEDAVPGSDQKDSLNEVFTAGQRAKDLVKQILIFARQSEEKVKPIRVGTIANEVIKFVRSTIPTSIEIKQRIASRSLIMGNPIQIHQIVMNLCTNAYHAMEETGGVLAIELKDILVDQGSMMFREGLKPGEYIELAISDTGAGIAPEVMAYIFDPYFTTKGPGAGTGLGLSVVHGIVENSGGKITVKSTPQKGTIFYVYLPVVKRSEDDHFRLPEQLPSGSERILFVDDEVPITQIGRQMLSRLGYSVTTRTSSVEALELFRSKPDYFDLVITDMTMPNISGDQLAAHLMDIRPDIPVILCTGYSNKISPQSAAEMGIKGFALKPIVKADLAKTIRSVLDQAKGESQ